MERKIFSQQSQCHHWRSRDSLPSLGDVVLLDTLLLRLSLQRPPDDLMQTYPLEESYTF